MEQPEIMNSSANTSASETFASETISGYLHPDYAESLAEFGTPRFLSNCGGYALDRAIAGSPHLDGMGLYPLFCCRDWTLLREDRAELGQNLVSLALVADPFGNHTQEILNQNFDRVCLFKEHFLTRLDKPVEAIANKHHRYYARKAFQQVQVSACSNPVEFLPEWTELYDTLIARHHLSGIKAFSERAFRLQLSVPGMVALKAVCEGETVAAHLWYLQNGVSYSHLAASSERGYKMSASYALYWFAIEYFTGKATVMDIGSGAGTNTGEGGLTEFKRGWATETLPVYFCGKIFDKDKYEALCRARQQEPTEFFPAYRKGEFG